MRDSCFSLIITRQDFKVNLNILTEHVRLGCTQVIFAVRTNFANTLILLLSTTRYQNLLLLGK